MHVGQTLASLVPQTPSVSATTPTPGSLTAAGYTADQGAEIGVAVSAVPLVGLLLGAIALSALSPSDVIPQWAWAVVGGAIGLAVGNQLGLAAVNTITPANPPAGVTPAAFSETAFYSQLAQTASSQLASYIAAQTSSSAAAASTVLPATSSS